jgi:hypothetical protein
MMVYSIFDVNSGSCETAKPWEAERTAGENPLNRYN